MMTTATTLSANSIEAFRLTAISAINSMALAKIDPGETYSPYCVSATEPVLELVSTREAWITENRHGWRILITPSFLPMIDIDFEDHPELRSVAELSMTLMPWLKSRYNQLQAKPPLRAYRTKGGLRLLVLTNKMDPRSSEFASLASAFGCDKRYLQLCQKQNCYRLRLSPKKDIFGLDYRACEYMGNLGGTLVDCRLTQRLVDLHDERTGALSRARTPLG